MPPTKNPSIYNPAVAHFIKEISDQNTLFPQNHELVPVSYLAELYNIWITHRGLSEIYHLKRGTFSFVLSHLPTSHEVHPMPILYRMKKAIRCVRLSLSQKPQLLQPDPNHPVLARGRETAYIGTDCRPFEFPPCNTQHFSDGARMETVLLSEYVKNERHLWR